MDESQKKKSRTKPSTGNFIPKSGRLNRPSLVQNKKVFSWEKIPDPILIGGILLFTFVLYLSSLKNGFIDWDDPMYILENPYIKHLTPASVARIFAGLYNGNYHPLTTLTWAVEYSIAGKSSLLYHIDNLGLHVLNVLLVFRFIKGIAGNRYLAAIVAFWFGIHPMHVESVAWISERKDLLYSLFFLLSMITYLKYLHHSSLSNEDPLRSGKKRKKYYFLTILFFLLSLLSKSAAVVLPLAMLLIDYLVKRKWSSTVFIEKIPFFILSLVFGLLALYSQKSGIHTDIGLILPFRERFFILNYGFFRYLTMLFFPYGMSVLHPYPVPGDDGFAAPVYLSLFFNLIIIGLVLFSMKYSRKHFFGFLFFIVTIILVLQILPVGGTYISERYTYIPYIGLFYILVSVMQFLWQRKPGTDGLKIVLFVIVLAISSEFIWITNDRIRIWNNSETLWTDAISKYPDYFQSYLFRGLQRNKNRNPDGALADFTSYIRIKADNPMVYHERGNIYFNKNKYDSAFIDYNIALLLDPTMQEAYNNRGVIKGIRGDIKGAIADFNKAIKLDPVYVHAFRNRGYAWMKINDSKAAIYDWLKAANLGDTVSMNYIKKYNKQSVR
ncbi:MAG: tetratricopeptide repeat protein [Bacteroidetes bacterium]|nr:tetratricopeptide repeat protein [Bacteroidota bacterium]